MIRVRDLKVWFPLRRGLLRELLGGKPQWVRALDGVSFDVKRGELFCLVGESGCGKTTTGKAMLGLVDATEGDILLEMPEEEYRTYEEVSRKRGDTDAERTKHELRRRYSLTWKEMVPWTKRQTLTLAAFILAALLSSILLPAGILGLLTVPFVSSWITLGASLVVGFTLGAVGTMPPTRPHRRTAVVLAALGVAAMLVLPIPAYFFYRARGGADAPAADPGNYLATAWNNDLFGMLLAIVFAPSVAGGVARTAISARQQAEGLAGIRMRNLRRRLQLIFQDPYESLNPKQSVYEIVCEPLQVNRVVTNPEEMSNLVVSALKDAGLRPPEEFMFRFPHELSGGQRQRVSIAAALVLQPDFIVADEPVSMLDVSIRTEILQLMMDLRRTRGITYLFITHDLGLAWVLADRIAVMYLGKIVEIGTVEQVIATPKHPYTQALISVVPSPDPRHRSQRMILKGERPDPVNIPTGCRFHPRCPVAFEKCGWEAHEVAEELQDALAASPLAGVGPLRVVDPLTLVAAGNPADSAAVALRDLVARLREQRRAFFGIASIEPEGGRVLVRLHAGVEPPLIEVQPGNAVACHLVATPKVPEPAVMA